MKKRHLSTVPSTKREGKVELADVQYFQDLQQQGMVMQVKTQGFIDYLTKKYGLLEGDNINPDGTIVRARKEKKEGDW